MITENKDFKGAYAIANSTDSEPNSDLVGNTEDLKAAIELYEPRCLILILGYTLYTQLKAELDKKPFNINGTTTADQIWIDLVNGVDQYEGLKKIIVPYVYFYYLQSDEMQHSGVGLVQENP